MPFRAIHNTDAKFRLNREDLIMNEVRFYSKITSERLFG